MGHPSMGGGREPEGASIPASRSLEMTKGSGCYGAKGREQQQLRHNRYSMSEKGLLPVKGLRFLVFSTLFVFGVFVTTAFPQTSPQRVIIDTDPGTDDSMAILLALNSPELKVEAFTV